MGAEIKVGNLPALHSPETLSVDLAARHGIEISPERIRQLADDNFLPSVYVDGKGPYFRKAAAKQWILDNLLEDRKPIPYPAVLTIIDSAHVNTAVGRVPKELAPIADQLYEFPMSQLVRNGCVYFLIREGRVIYVGQSTCLLMRIWHHDGRKLFDRVLYLTVPESHLDVIEAQFIRALNPELNQIAGRNGVDGDLPPIATLCSSALASEATRSERPIGEGAMMKSQRDEVIGHCRALIGFLPEELKDVMAAKSTIARIQRRCF